MRILITTIGTRGDVQPYVALGKGLQKVGYAVKIATAPLFEDFIRAHGLDFGAIHVDPRDAFDQNLAEIGKNPIQMMRWLKRQYDRELDQFVRDVLGLIHGVDAVVYSALSFMAYHIAEAYEKPSAAAYLQPVNPSRAFSSPAALAPDGLPFQKLVNWWSFKLSNQLLFQLIKGPLNRLRTATLGLPPLPRGFLWRLDTAEIPIIYGYSPSLLPKPDDWDEAKHVTGYWFLDDDQNWNPPPALTAFLQAGPPPVSIGMGSMPDQDSVFFTELVVEALAMTGQRGILLGGWAKLGGDDLPGHILALDAAPHSWLFPRMAAVVHHGGAGTTAAGLRAGKPAVVVPFFADQPWWGWLVARAGAGPAPIHRKELSLERLAAGIQAAVSDPLLRSQAAALGEQIRAEDGVGQAVALLEHYLFGNSRRFPPKKS